MYYMATLTPIDKDRMNPREADIIEQAKLRKVAIQNMQRDNLEAQAIWRDKQMKSYGNLIPITDDIPLSKIITDEQQAQSQDEFIQRQHALANLATIADQNNTEYIIDRLSPEQMRWMNDNWLGLLRQVKKRYSKMDKNVFVNTVIQDSAQGVSYEDLAGATPTAAMEIRSGLKAGEAQEVADRLAAQSQAEEDRRVSEEEAGLEQNRLNRIAGLTNRNQNKANIRNRRQTAAISAARALKPSTQVITPPPSPRGLSPMRNAAAEAIRASNLFASLQDKQAAALQASAGGSQNVVSPLVQVGPTLGNVVKIPNPNVKAKDTSSIPSKSLIPTLIRQKSVSATDTDIAKSLNLPDITDVEKIQFAENITELNRQMFGEKTDKLKTQIIRKIGKEPFETAAEEIKQLTGARNLNESIYKKMLILIKVDELKGNTRPTATSGKGLKKKRVIRGRGYTKNEHKIVKPRRHYINEHFYVDLNRLDNNILCVKYASNDSNLPRLKVQQITSKTAELIRDILNDKFDERIFKMLTTDEKRTVRRFVKALKLDINTNDEEEQEFQKQFEIVRGEYMSGNDSPQIKSALKSYVLQALQENKIAKNEAYTLLYSLSL